MFKHGDQVIVREPGFAPYRAIVVRCEGMARGCRTVIFDPNGGWEHVVLTEDLRDAPKSLVVT